LLLNKIALSLPNIYNRMKYSEVERKLKKSGCYEDGQMSGHPMWYSPLTDKHFKMSHHKSEEVKLGTLKGISKQSGVKL
jgi:predicted RNA binding protein YcfA (HicA-like mRNA interferase family)